MAELTLKEQYAREHPPVPALEFDWVGSYKPPAKAVPKREVVGGIIPHGEDSTVGAKKVVVPVQAPSVITSPVVVPEAQPAPMFDIGQGIQNVQALIHRNVVQPIQRGIHNFPFSREAFWRALGGTG